MNLDEILGGDDAEITPCMRRMVLRMVGGKSTEESLDSILGAQEDETINSILGALESEYDDPGPRGGGYQTYTANKDIMPAKDSTTSKLIRESPSECACHIKTDVCSGPEIINSLSTALNITAADPKVIITQAKEQLGCTTERCVLVKAKEKIGTATVEKELFAKFKVEGPVDSALLSNKEIDAVLKQWTLVWNEFYAYNFNMLDYNRYSIRGGHVVNSPDTLATINFADLYANGKKCCACIINSDKYSGPGKHWMALFADARGRDTWTVEFFNSSGNPPAIEWINWLKKTQTEMGAINEGTPGSWRPKIEIVNVTGIRHQKSRSECGPYSLFYIWSRLNGVLPEYFNTHPIPDQLMFEFRRQLFRDRSGNNNDIKKFNWSEFKKQTKIEWE